jgi:hypothetical protein
MLKYKFFEFTADSFRRMAQLQAPGSFSGEGAVPSSAYTGSAVAPIIAPPFAVAPCHGACSDSVGAAGFVFGSIMGPSAETLSEHDELHRLREEVAALRLARVTDAAQLAELQARCSAAAAAEEDHTVQRERLGVECERLMAEGKVMKQAFMIQGRRSRELEQRVGELDAARRELSAAVQRLEQSNYIMSVQLAQQDLALRQAAAAGHFFGGGPDRGLG